MLKRDVQTHRSGYGGKAYPAVNVKYYGPSHTQAVADKFGCDDATAERACEFAWQAACEQFWEQATEAAHEFFGTHVKVYSAGRSGGWLILDGLPEVSDWDAIALMRYVRMVHWCEREIKFRTARDYVLDEIDANEWAKTGAELYNFVDTDAGTKCIADLKDAASAAGFGPVVRK